LSKITNEEVKMKTIIKIVSVLIVLQFKALFSFEHHIALLTEPIILEELSLTKEQREKIRSLHFETQKNAENIKSKIRIEEIELKELLFKEKPEIEKIEEKIKKIGDLNSELRILKIKEFLKIREILTPEQFEKFREIVRTRPFLRERIRRFRD
jgi:hypothetical protein